MHQSTDNYFGPFLPYSLCDFWISHLEKTSKWHGWKKNSYLQHIYSVYAKCSFLLVLYLVINTAGQIKHLQTFEKQVLLPLLRSARSKDLSKISYAETVSGYIFCCEKVQLRRYECFLTNPSDKGQKEIPFQGSSSYLPDNHLRTRKVICWSCLFLFTDSACSQNTYFKCMGHFWKKDKKR